MLKINIGRVFALRGVANPLGALMKLGISRATANNLLRNKVRSIHEEHLEKMCEALNCTPDDLYEWRPASDTPAVDSHPLRGLRRDTKPARYADIIRSIPLDKLDQVAKVLATLTDDQVAPN